MPGLTDDQLLDDLDSFLSTRKIFKVECDGQETWLRWKRNRVVEYPGPSESGELDESWRSYVDSIEVGDVIIAQGKHGSNGVFHTFGLGVVTDDNTSDLESPDSDSEYSIAGYDVHWVTVADNGEERRGDVPEEFPSEQVVRVDRAFFEDLLIGLDAGGYPPPSDELVSRLFRAAAMRDLESILDSHLPSFWKETEPRKGHVRAVVEQYLLNDQRGSPGSSRREAAIQMATTIVDAEIEVIQQSVFPRYLAPLLIPFLTKSSKCSTTRSIE